MLVRKRRQRGRGRGRPLACLVMCYKDREKTQIESSPEFYSEGFDGNAPETFPSKKTAVAFVRSVGGRIDNNTNGLQQVIESRRNGHFYEIDERVEIEGEDPF